MSETDDLVECRLCGKRWLSLGHHLRWGHGISADEYRDRFGIRRSMPLTCAATRSRFQATITQTIALGHLDAHYAQNGERASTAAEIAASTKRAMREKGIELPHGAPATPRTAIEKIVAAVESGVKVATAVKRGALSYSGFHAGLARHPDLKARHDAARAALRKNRTL